MSLWKPEVDQFERAVSWLNPEAKQAFYAAAASRTIKRGTWNGCAFNAGGEEIGIVGVKNYQAAAAAFDLPVKSVMNFIAQWDQLPGNDEACNQRLRETIAKVGLFSPRGVFRLRSLVFKAQETEKEVAIFEQIDRYVSDPDITDDELHSLIDGYKEASELIGA